VGTAVLIEDFGLHGMVSAILSRKSLSRLMKKVDEALEVWELMNGNLDTSEINLPALEEVDYDSLQREMEKIEEMEEKLRTASINLGKRATYSLSLFTKTSTISPNVVDMTSSEVSKARMKVHSLSAIVD
jgi:glycosylphosphatidylinositol transamidase (GPIT) subunit GPI8